MVGMYIKDNNVNLLAEKLMLLGKMKTKTEAVEHALRLAIEDALANTTVKDRVAPAIEAARQLGPNTKDKFDAKELLNDNWGLE